MEERELWRSVRLACQCEVTTRGLMAVLGLSMVRVFRVAGRLFQLPRAYWGQYDNVVQCHIHFYMHIHIHVHVLEVYYTILY